MKWLSSLDELLYEVMSWLLFFPLTFWRTISRPIDMMDYADRQLALPQAEQYLSALKPPLFLALSLLLAHGLSLALGQADPIVANRHGLADLVDDDTSALVLRLIIFAAFPIFTAARLTRRRGLPLDRASLRLPFYAQCYPTAVFAFGLSAGSDLLRIADPRVHVAGLTVVGISLLYYAAVETRWFKSRLGIGYLRAAGAVALGLTEGLALLLFVAFLFTR